MNKKAKNSYENIVHDEIDSVTKTCEQIIVSLGGKLITERKENATWVLNKEDYITEQVARSVYKFRDGYVCVDKMYFPEKPFIVLEFADEIEGPYEDADPFPFDLSIEEVKLEIEYALGVLPYPSWQERAKADKKKVVVQGTEGIKKNAEVITPPKFSVSVAAYEKEGSNLCGLARIYIEDCFIINNVNILQGKEKVFVAMPSYKTKQKDENGKDIYQDICYPVTRDFREKLYGEIERAYEEAKTKQQEKRNTEEKKRGSGNDGFVKATSEELPFR